MPEPPARHCDLCDLPFAQCTHGLARRQARAVRKQTTKTAAAKLKTGTSGSLAPSKSGTPSKCATCGKRARYGRYRLCLSCGKKAGFRLCRRCGRDYQPEAGTVAKKPMCVSCRRGSSRRSVWAPASAGSPGLGKRA